jgi:hypothetical protein
LLRCRIPRHFVCACGVEGFRTAGMPGSRYTRCIVRQVRRH